jgi:hypothetical protein
MPSEQGCLGQLEEQAADTTTQIFSSWYFHVCYQLREEAACF